MSAGADACAERPPRTPRHAARADAACELASASSENLGGRNVRVRKDLGQNGEDGLSRQTGQMTIDNWMQKKKKARDRGSPVSDNLGSGNCIRKQSSDIHGDETESLDASDISMLQGRSVTSRGNLHHLSSMTS